VNSRPSVIFQLAHRADVAGGADDIHPPVLIADHHLGHPLGIGAMATRPVTSRFSASTSDISNGGAETAAPPMRISRRA